MHIHISIFVSLIVAAATPSTLLARSVVDESVASVESHVRAGPNLKSFRSVRARKAAFRIWQRYESALDRSRRGFQQRSMTKQVQFHREAARRMERVMRSLDRWQRTYVRDPAVLTESVRLRAVVRAAEIRIQLDLASAYTSRGSYRPALNAVRKVLAWESRHPEATKRLEHLQWIMASAR